MDRTPEGQDLIRQLEEALFEAAKASMAASINFKSGTFYMPDDVLADLVKEWKDAELSAERFS